MQRGRVDGVLFFSMKFPEHYVPRFQQLNLPVVLVDTSRPEFDSITVENQRGAYLATSHLLELQHRRIGMIDASLTSEPARVRLEGYRQALEEHELPFDENLVRFSRNMKLDGFNREAGYEAMKELLSLGSNRPTAVFVASDVQAIGALQALREEGLRIPEDMALIGFDDIELAEHAGLSTMRQPMYEMGTLAVEILVERIKNPNAPPRHTSFTPEIVVRETCGARKFSFASSEKRSIYNLSLGDI